MRMLWTAIRFSAVLMLICGLIYPVVTTGAARALFPAQAEGSLIRENGVVWGSRLLARQVDSPKLFHPRASAAGYDPTASAGSNMAVASSAYIRTIAHKAEALRLENPMLEEIPADLVTGSGSGLDPDLSPAAAVAQTLRISRESGIPREELVSLIHERTKKRQWGVFGEPRVNVMELNLELLKRLKP